MTKYIVEGGRPLFGEIHISGAKNAAVAIIPAALMVSGPCRIENMPQISDVTILLGILQDLGAKVRYVNPHTVEIDSSSLRSGRVPYESARRCRASYYMLGALLGRFGSADVALPGGCDFGSTRPIDQHLKGFRALGAQVDTQSGFVMAEAAGGRVKGANIFFDKVSVGATINIMLAAAMAATARVPYCTIRLLARAEAKLVRKLLVPLGRPRAMICRSSRGAEAASLGDRLRLALFLRTYHSRYAAPAALPSTVAAAAPATPKGRARMNSGSSATLVTVEITPPFQSYVVYSLSSVVIPAEAIKDRARLSMVVISALVTAPLGSKSPPSLPLTIP